jgi:8-oxo-dGTP pyrophosphatase MutT (NUDIX family)
VSGAESLQPIPAATVILYHEPDDGPAEHLMIERSAGMTFAAGALVFPGGRVDPDDHLIARSDTLIRNAPDDLEDRAARVAAIREALEETGVALGITPLPDPATLSAWRSRLKRHERLSVVLQGLGAVMDLAILVPFARWCPNLGEHRRFDTRFYIARVDHRQAVELDADEAAQHCWITAESAIRHGTAGDHRIICPTMRNLERLASCARFDEAVAHLAGVELRTISPQIREEDGDRWLCIPADAGYPVTRVRFVEVTGP